MKKPFFLIGVLLLFACPAGAQVLYQASMQSQRNLDEFSKDPAASISSEGVTFELAERTDYRFITRSFDPALSSSRLLRISCEVRAENILPKKNRFDGIKLLFSMQNESRKQWGEVSFPDGSFEWQTFQTTIATLPALKSITLAIGMQRSAGKFQMRNLKVEAIGIPVAVRSVANMALKDPEANDGKGGWTDQGPLQDGSCFSGHLYSKNFAGIPIDAEPEGNGVLTMHSKHFTPGPKSVTVSVAPAEKAKSLYLLHTMAWGPALADKRVGTISLRDCTGSEQSIPVTYNHDVADWYRSVAVLPNGYAALRGRTGDGEVAGVYLSRFEVDSTMGEIVSVGFQSNPDGIWLILGATLSAETIPLPSTAVYKVEASDQWLPVARADKHLVKPGSALDLSSYMLPGTVDELGRIIIRDGHFVFEKEPTRQVRFLTEAMHPGTTIPKSHADIELFAEEIRRNGYNMVRTHFLDADLMGGMSNPGEFNPEVLDRIDYFIACMKKQGIYLNFDCMTSWIGYMPGNIHQNNDSMKSFKYRIFFDPAVRENWRKGVEAFLCRVNPYTQTRLIDDPVLVMAVAYNEQEFGFWRDFDGSFFLPKWHAFLKNKYGAIEKLNEVWKRNSSPFKSFDEIPCFRNSNDIDAAQFLYPYEAELLRWYERQMHDLGFQGSIVNYNCGKNQYYNLLRKDSPLVAMNHYHAHPSAWISKHSFISQNSSIESKAVVLRNFIGTRQSRKPFVITEHGFVFWNKFRYEQGFVIGGYSAFQDFDAITLHASPVAFQKGNGIMSFGTWLDPIAKASEFLTYFLFIREDITAGKPMVRIRVLRRDVFRPDGVAGGFSNEQSLPALLVGTSVECTETASEQLPLFPGEIAYKLGATSTVAVNNAGFSGSEDNPAANMAELLMHLRKSGAITADNRSDGKTRFENSTKEIFLDSARSYMQIDTSRLQGVCALAGTRAKLSDFEIMDMSSDGNLALVSVDGLAKIFDARRLVLVYATNALNSGMEFTDSEMITLLDNGNAPTLLQRGAFTVKLNNRNAANLKLYPLDLAGNRLKTIEPKIVGKDHLIFSVDTGKDGAAVYFEIAIR